jgi:NAD(P)-dependent dehydrogenase (short-subunit alcohol dehydrogenase family)
VLVNNAGMESIMSIEHMDMATFDRIWSVNVRAAVELTHLLLPLLKRSGAASIINVTSIHDTMPYPHNAAYSMSKAALAMFTKTIAVELAPHGIRANNFAPGAVETDINRDVLQDIGHENFRQWIPAGRVAQTSEMIGPALFLASDASSYVTGATLYADGGYLQNLVRYRPQQ